MDYEGWEAMDGELIRIVQRWRTTVAVSAALHDWHVWNTCLEFFHLLKRGWTATIICSSSWALSIGFLFMLNVKWILNVMFKPCKISPWGRLMKLCWQKKKKKLMKRKKHMTLKCNHHISYIYKKKVPSKESSTRFDQLHNDLFSFH